VEACGRSKSGSTGIPERNSARGPPLALLDDPGTTHRHVHGQPSIQSELAPSKPTAILAANTGPGEADCAMFFGNHQPVARVAALFLAILTTAAARAQPVEDSDVARFWNAFDAIRASTGPDDKRRALTRLHASQGLYG
jgi:hypothetical protein